MLHRIIYACVQAYKHRKLLTNYAIDHNLQAASILDLSPQELFANGIKCLVIDFDGVLASHAKIQPPLAVGQWLQECCTTFGANKIFILSNKPTLARKHYFAQHFNGVNFIITKYKKPFPYSILNILQLIKLLPSELLVIDDRLLTGILAAVLSKVRGCLITKPFVDYQYCPIQERIYFLARNLEQKLFKI